MLKISKSPEGENGDTKKKKINIASYNFALGPTLSSRSVNYDKIILPKCLWLCFWVSR